MPLSLKPGAMFAGYKVKSQLGAGGMAVVYLAWDPVLERHVALKIMNEKLAGDTHFQQRFIRESKLAAALTHPNVVPVYAAGEADGLLYLAMQYVEGTDLKALLRTERRLDFERTLSIMGQVGRALDAAHQRGLIHRDVKPANILIVPRSDPKHADEAYLSDFGLTKRRGSETGLTVTGQFMGTLDYVSPEQIQGGEIDGRVDVYSLGCLLYECLIGVPPFERDSEAAMIYAHLKDPPPLCSQARSDLPSGIDAVVVKAMAKNKNRRYPSAGALVDAARACLVAPAATDTLGAQTRVRRPKPSPAVAPLLTPGPAGPPPGAPPGSPPGPPSGAGAPPSAAGAPPSAPGPPPGAPGPPPGAPGPPPGAPGTSPAPPPAAPQSAPFRSTPPGPAPFGTMAWFLEHREVVAVVAVVAVLVVIVAGSFVFSGNALAKNGEVVTQPSASPGAQAFTPSVATPDATPSTTPKPPSNPNATSVSGEAPGLYGGTLNNSTCDRSRLIAFLQANPDKAAAWAGAEGISVGDIPGYIRGLTPVLLRYDTRVTNHGFSGGVAVPYQAVLQAGTAVLVDRYGVPRARCYCGNPLLPPLTQYSPRYTGDRWPGFSSTTIIIIIAPPQPVTTLTLADPNGKAIEVPVGTDGPNKGTTTKPPTPVPVPPPGGSPTGVTGNYTLAFAAGGGTLIGSGKTVTAGYCAAVQAPGSRMDVVASGSRIDITFSDVAFTGTFNSGDNSFTVEPSKAETTHRKLKGRFDGQGGASGALDFTYDYGGGDVEGCSLPFTARKVA